MPARWFVTGRLVGIDGRVRPLKSGLLTFSQARRFAARVEAVGGEAKIRELEPEHPEVAARWAEAERDGQGAARCRGLRAAAEVALRAVRRAELAASDGRVYVQPRQLQLPLLPLTRRNER